MTRRAGFVLRLSVIWTVWVWVVLIRNMVVDHGQSWSFRLVHIGLALVSLAFAAAIWQVTGRARRFTREVDRNFHYRPAVKERQRRSQSPGPGPGPGHDDSIVVTTKPVD